MYRSIPSYARKSLPVHALSVTIMSTPAGSVSKATIAMVSGLSAWTQISCTSPTEKSSQLDTAAAGGDDGKIVHCE